MKSFNVTVSCMQHEVTGSSFLLSASYPDGNRNNLIIDFGSFQEFQYQDLNKTLPDVSIKNIDAVFITHDHIDHDGRLPYLVRNGYEGPIYTSIITSKYLRQTLENTGNIIQRELKNKKVKINPDAKPDQVFYFTSDDVDKTMELVKAVNFTKKMRLNENIYFTFFANGHMTGASIILIQIIYPGQDDKYFLFSGDYKKDNLLFKVDKLPEEVTKLPLNVFIESTYGSASKNDVTLCFKENISQAIKNGFTVIAYSLAKNRPIQILKELYELQKSGDIPQQLPIYLDGKSLIWYLKMDLKLFGDKVLLPNNIKLVTGKGTRERLLKDKSSKIIITTSGMGSFGPAPTYTAAYIGSSRALLQFNCYCAEGTFGDKLANVAKGQCVPFKINNIGPLTRQCDIKWTGEFSSHGKIEERLEFLKQFKNILSILIQHGSHRAQSDFQAEIIHNIDIPKDKVIIMKPGIHYQFCKKTIKKLCFTKISSHK